MRLATTQLYKEYPEIQNKVNHILDPQKHNTNIQWFKNNISREITIYDLTKNQTLKNKQEIVVSDHINQTGGNPLIGNQKKTQTTFLDISNKYKSKTGVTTHSIGDKFKNHHAEFSYPSVYLCHAYILFVALGCKKIDARLINIL